MEGERMRDEEREGGRWRQKRQNPHSILNTKKREETKKDRIVTDYKSETKKE